MRPIVLFLTYVFIGVGVIVLVTFVSGCAKPAHQDSMKSIQSIWSADYPNWTMDFSQFSLNEPFQIEISYLSGGKCLAAAIADGSNLAISNSLVIENESGMAPCSMFDGHWTYFVNDGVLTACQDDKPCVVLH